MKTRNVLEGSSSLPLFFPQLADSRPFQSARGQAQSKTWRTFVGLVCFFILPSTFCLQASGQSYSIDWYKVAGGGGTSSGGVYSVSGTIGQHDAGGPMTGGGYSLTGGLWTLISVAQTPGAPTLYISHSGSAITIYWQDVSGWNLEQNNNLANTGGWTPSSGVTTSNGTNYLSVTPYWKSISPPE